MLSLAVSLSVLAALGYATPVQQKPRAQVIPLGPRTTIAGAENVFNAELAHRDRTRMLNKYSKLSKIATPGNPSAAAEKRSTMDEPLDINLFRRATSGKDALTDDYDGIDERE